MAATIYSSLYTSAGVPISGRPRRANTGGCIVDSVTITLPTTNLDTLADTGYIIPVPSFARLQWIAFDSSDMDTGSVALDLDLVLRTTLGGVNTDTVLFNAGTAFGTAIVGRFIGLTTQPQVPNATDSYGSIIAYCNVAATTPAEGTIALTACWVMPG